MLIIVFYATDGKAAKLRARGIHANKPHMARTYDVTVWNGEYDHCDGVEIMPDVLNWQRDKIMKVYADKVLTYEDEKPKEEEVTTLEAVTSEVLPGAKETETLDIAITGEKHIKHLGAGRWFVMQGEERLSGPHTKEEAQKEVDAG